MLEPLTRPEDAIDGAATHPPDGNVFRHQRIVHGDADATGAVMVEGTYELGMQDQAFLGLEAALALPDPGGGGVELHIATQWLHEDRKQIAACLGLPEEKVRLVLGGVGGAFGAREDISLQVHCCLLALRTGPAREDAVRARRVLPRARAPPSRTIWMRHHADRRRPHRQDRGRGSCSTAARTRRRRRRCSSTASRTRRVRTTCPNAVVDGWAVRTNNPPCGAMRGFGVVQACFAHEGQMDKLAAALRPRSRSSSGCATPWRPATA